MKKVIILAYLVLFSAVLSCATTPSTHPISPSDLPDLKGKWRGLYQDRRTPTYVQPVELEIEDYKDLQLKGMITMSHADRPPSSFPFYGKIENGKIKFSWQRDQFINHINLALHKDGDKMKLQGEYRIREWEGTISLEKVK